ncbi:hypothetical protein Tco_0350921, partial [Tanacetum coccineum]
LKAAVSFAAIVASTVSAACWFYAAAAYFMFVSADGIKWFLLAVQVAVSADYVHAGHVLIFADRYRIC